MEKRNQYNALPVTGKGATLRKLAAQRGVGTGGWRASASREQLTAALVAQDEGKAFTADAGNGNGTAPASDTARYKALGVAPPPASDADGMHALARMIQPHLNLERAGIDADEVKRICRAMMPEPQTLRIHNTTTGVKREIDRQHYLFPLLCKCYEARVPVMLVGPAGSGKTTVAGSVASAYDVAFDATSFGPMTTKGDLFGIRDAPGHFHSTSLVRIATKGGVFLGDEMDAANAGVLTQVNMLLANGHFSTPEGLQEKSDGFWFVAGCNTYGLGANRVMVGRNQLDGATLDRFAVIDFPIDTGLEASAVKLTGYSSPKLTMDAGGIPTVKDWMERVQAVRAACEKLELRHVVSPRATIYGAQLAMLEVGRDHLDAMLLWKGLDAATVAKVKAAMK